MFEATILNILLLTQPTHKDVKTHCNLTRQLLDHYHQTLRDRQVYWLARERAKTVGDVLVVICDSYDKAKVTLPRWPFQRCPKRALYEKIRRKLTAVTQYVSYNMFVVQDCFSI